MIPSYLSRVVHSCVVGIVVCSAVACGGGTDASAVSSSAPSASASDPKRAALAAETTGWIFVASEGQDFSVAGSQTVRYGSGSAWVARVVTNGGQCSNGYFGTDPLFGSVKQCEVSSTSAGWVPVATEGQTFVVSGTRAVRYGSDASWIVKIVSGSGECSNAYFGNDPLFGTVKRCEVDDATDPGWTQIAEEGQPFVTGATQTVRYGAESSWITKEVSGAADCSNSYFGSDPLFGVKKRCETSGVAAAPTPPEVPAPPAPSPVPPLLAAAGICTPPIGLVDTSGTAASVGDGTPGSCTESALRAALASKSVITFNCGPAPVTIPISSTIAIPTNRDTVIDGGNRVTLDGGNTTRILSLVQQNYRTNTLGLTLQHVRLVNGKATGTGYVAPDPNNPKCAYGFAEGAGAAIEVRDARLHVIDSQFENNAAASPGPDVGGGAIYAVGSLDVTIVGSSFVGNSGSNAGAVGMLQSNLSIANSVFQGNSATGIGQNFASAEVANCPGIGHPGQGGAGGIGGAIMIDGSDNTDAVVCGARFIANRANDLAGAFFRTSNGPSRRTVLDRTLFQGNRAKQAGAAFVMNSSPLDITASTFAGNVADVVGAAQILGSRLNVVSSTFAGNEATAGVGGALMLFNGADSLMLNVTFVDNKSSGGPGFFSAAIFGDMNFPVRNTVFSNNVSNDGGSPMQCSFQPANGSNNLQWPINHIVGGAPDTPCVNGIIFSDPLLGTLGDYGGPTPTVTPTAASPLRGAGSDCPETDQRGVARNTSRCTVGAVE